MSVTINAAGWTEIVPTGRVIHVSSSSGADAYGGTSPDTAVRTVSKGKSLSRPASGDMVLFKGTDTFTEPIGKLDKPGVVYGSYGGGRAKFRTPGTPIFCYGSGSNCDDVVLLGLDFEPANPSGGDTKGFELLRPASNMLIEDCRFAKFGGNLVLMGQAGLIEGLRIRRSQILDSTRNGGHSQGIYTEETRGFSMFECLVANNGHPATIFNHGLYFQNGQGPATLEGCVLAGNSSHGAQFRSGGTFKGGLVTDSAIGLLFGGGNTPDLGGVPMVIQASVILNGKDITPSEKRGWAVVAANTSGGRVSDLTIAHNKGGQPQAFRLENGAQNTSISRTIVHDWPGGLSKSSDSFAPVESGNDWNRPASKCVDPTRNLPAGYIQALRNQSKATWDPKLWGLPMVRKIAGGYALK